MRQPRILMCPPDYYGIEYEINPWMSRQRGATPERARAQVLHRLVLPLELVNPYFYHLDTCFCPLAPGEAIYYPDAFDAYGRRVLEKHIPRLLAAGEADAHRFGCNAVAVGKTVVVNAG